MKFSFSVRNSKFLKTLFRGKASFVDVFVNENIAVLYVDSVDVFAYSMYGIVVDGVGESLSFRIPRESFLSIVEDGIFYVSVFDGVVYVKVDNGSFSHTLSFGQQICSVVNVVEKIDLFSRSLEYARVDVSDLSLISRLGRTSRFPISIESGIAFLELDGVMIFSRTKCVDMSLFPAELNGLLSVCYDSSKIFNIENYVAFVDDGCGYVITKATSLSNNNYSFVRRDKEIDAITVDFSSASSLLSKVRKFDYVVFDINSSEFSLQCDGGVQFSAPIRIVPENVEIEGTSEGTGDVFDEILAKASSASYVRQYPSVVLPEIVFRQMLYLSKSRMVRFSFTKLMVRVKISDNTLLVSRR
jgi:hypothetical protein